MPQDNRKLSFDGNFFEDFAIGRTFRHATPRTITQGDASFFIALTGARQPLNCSEPLAVALGLRAMPIDDVLLFNIAFGKTVPDISANAVANLGYADVRFVEPVYPGDTIAASSEVIGLRETSGGAAGVVYVRSQAVNQHGRTVLSWVRWVLVRKRDRNAPPAPAVVPELPAAVEIGNLAGPALSADAGALIEATGCERFWDDYAIGDRIDHPAGMTLDESDHTLATKLYQNNAKVHFDTLAMQGTAHGRRLVYGGHVISMCRALSYDGLENAAGILAINGGTHSAPTFAGDTIYCLTEVIDRHELPGRPGWGALRLRLVGIRNQPAAGFALRVTGEKGEQANPAIVLDLDYTILMTRGH